MQRSVRQRNRTRKDSEEPQLPSPTHLVAFHSYLSTARTLLLAIQLPPPTGKSKSTTGDQESAERCRYWEVLGRLSLEDCVDQGGHGPAGDFPPQGALCNLEGVGRAPLCSVEPWKPHCLHFDMQTTNGALCLSYLPFAGQRWLCSEGWSDHHLFACPDIIYLLALLQVLSKHTSAKPSMSQAISEAVRGINVFAQPQRGFARTHTAKQLGALAEHHVLPLQAAFPSPE